MSPDKRSRLRSKRRENPAPPVPPSVRVKPSPDDPYEVAYYQRHAEDDARQGVPGRDFLLGCPQSVKAKMMAVVVEVAASPPHRFAGGGYWEAMHGNMTGYYEVRADGPQRTHYRLFCRLDTEAHGQGPLLVIIWGASKRFRTKFTERTYTRVRMYGDEYLSRNPRSILS